MGALTILSIGINISIYCKFLQVILHMLDIRCLVWQGHKFNFDHKQNHSFNFIWIYQQKNACFYITVVHCRGFEIIHVHYLNLFLHFPNDPVILRRLQLNCLSKSKQNAFFSRDQLKFLILVINWARHSQWQQWQLNFMLEWL